MLRLLVSLIAAVTIAGCASDGGVDLSGVSNALKSVADRGKANDPKPEPYKTIKDFPELAGVFARAPSRGLGDPKWPRVAITVTAVPRIANQSFFGPAPSRPMAADCITFNVTLWTSDKDSRQFAGLKTCPSEFRPPRTPHKDVEDWMNMNTIMMGHSGNVRTAGPVPPAQVWPPNPEALQWAFGGKYLTLYLAGILDQLGYLAETPVTNTGRIWMVSVPPYSTPVGLR